MRYVGVVVLAITIFPGSLAFAETTVQSNVVYGMYSGAALLMDVYLPASPNGYGLIHINGSGWHTPEGYGAKQLKSPRGPILTMLAEAGFTVFTINHRAAPTFRYPAAVHDAQRAVRYVRHHANEYGIRPDRLGAIGGSSGGHLVALLGVLDGAGKIDALDPVETESAKVQCVVAIAPATALLKFKAAPAEGVVTSFMGLSSWYAQDWIADSRVIRPAQPNVKAAFERASPITHVSSDDAPFLLIHGDQDDIIPVEQSKLMKAELEAAGVPARLLLARGVTHFIRSWDYIADISAWFDAHLVEEDHQQ